MSVVVMLLEMIRFFTFLFVLKLVFILLKKLKKIENGYLVLKYV